MSEKFEDNDQSNLGSSDSKKLGRVKPKRARFWYRFFFVFVALLVCIVLILFLLIQNSSVLKWGLEKAKPSLLSQGIDLSVEKLDFRLTSGLTAENLHIELKPPMAHQGVVMVSSFRFKYNLWSFVSGRIVIQDAVLKGVTGDLKIVVAGEPSEVGEKGPPFQISTFIKNPPIELELGNFMIDIPDLKLAATTEEADPKFRLNGHIKNLKLDGNAQLEAGLLSGLSKGEWQCLVDLSTYSNEKNTLSRQNVSAELDSHFSVDIRIPSTVEETKLVSDIDTTLKNLRIATELAPSTMSSITPSITQSAKNQKTSEIKLSKLQFLLGSTTESRLLQSKWSLTADRLSYPDALKSTLRVGLNGDFNANFDKVTAKDGVPPGQANLNIQVDLGKEKIDYPKALKASAVVDQIFSKTIVRYETSIHENAKWLSGVVKDTGASSQISGFGSWDINTSGSASFENTEPLWLSEASVNSSHKSLLPSHTGELELDLTQSGTVPKTPFKIAPSSVTIKHSMDGQTVDASLLFDINSLSLPDSPLKTLDLDKIFHIRMDQNLLFDKPVKFSGKVQLQRPITAEITSYDGDFEVKETSSGQDIGLNLNSVYNFPDHLMTVLRAPNEVLDKLGNIDGKTENRFRIEVDSQGNLRSFSAISKNQISPSESYDGPLTSISNTKLVSGKPLDMNLAVDSDGHKIVAELDVSSESIQYENFARLGHLKTHIRVEADDVSLAPKIVNGIKFSQDMQFESLDYRPDLTPNLSLSRMIAPVFFKLDSKIDSFTDTQFRMDLNDLNLKMGENVVDATLTGFVDIHPDRPNLDEAEIELETKIEFPGKIDDQLTATGSISIPANLRLLPNSHLSFESQPVTREVSLKISNDKQNISLKNMNGSVYVSENLLFTRGNFSFEYLEDLNPFTRVDYRTFEPALSQEHSLKIDELTLDTLKIQAITCDLSLTQNQILLSEMSAKLLDGQVFGHSYVSLQNQDIKLGFLGRLSQLNPSILEEAKRQSNSTTQEPVRLNGRTGIEVSLANRMVEGRMDLTSIGPESLNGIFAFLDPKYEDPQINQARKALQIASPSSVAIEMHEGNLDLEVEFNRNLVPDISIRSVPLTPLIVSTADEQISSLMNTVFADEESSDF